MEGLERSANGEVLAWLLTRAAHLTGNRGWPRAALFRVPPRASVWTLELDPNCG